MSRIFVHGLGAVSPAGWGVSALRGAVEGGPPAELQEMTRPGWPRPLSVRLVPPPPSRPQFLSHPRLRRSSVITHHALAAALEALGGDVEAIQTGRIKLGIVFCVTAGCVACTRRFFEEVMQNPAMASPMVFPETVLNAPASHLAAFFGTSAISYTLAGDEGVYLEGLALAAGWLLNGQASGVIVVGAEESDWLISDAIQRFQRGAVHSHGAGALYLRAIPPDFNGVELAGVTDSVLYRQQQNRDTAASRMRAQLPPERSGELLCTSEQGLSQCDRAEVRAWDDWRGVRWRPKVNLGEALTASAAWQCVAGCDGIRQGLFPAANISVVGANQQAIGARFIHPG